MAVIASLFDFDGQLGIDVYLDGVRERVRDDPPVPIRTDSPWIFEWDAEALEEHGRHEFLSLFTTNLSAVTDADIDELDRLPLPPIDYPPAGLHDARISSLVRWARGRIRTGRIAPRSA